MYSLLVYTISNSMTHFVDIIIVIKKLILIHEGIAISMKIDAEDHIKFFIILQIYLQRKAHCEDYFTWFIPD